MDRDRVVDSRWGIVRCRFGTVDWLLEFARGVEHAGLANVATKSGTVMEMHRHAMPRSCGPSCGLADLPLDWPSQP